MPRHHFSAASFICLHGPNILINPADVQDADLSLTLFQDLSVACDELASLSAEVDGLAGDETAIAECLSEGRKRATGQLRLAITLSQTPPYKGCLKLSSCRRLQVLLLSFKARAVINKAKAGGIKVNVTNTQTSEVTEVQLSGSLKPVSNTVQRTCAAGTVLNVYSCGEFSFCAVYACGRLYNLIHCLICVVWCNFPKLFTEADGSKKRKCNSVLIPFSLQSPVVLEHTTVHLDQDQDVIPVQRILTRMDRRRHHANHVQKIRSQHHTEASLWMHAYVSL